MAQKKTDALNLSLLILALTLEISFSHAVKLNVALIVLALGFLGWRRAFRSLIVLLLLPLIPAASSYWAITLHATDTSYALLLFVRTYAFTALGLVFLTGVDLEALLLWLEQHKLSPNFVYGLLVVIHALPQIMREVADLSGSESAARSETASLVAADLRQGHLRCDGLAGSVCDRHVCAWLHRRRFANGSTAIDQFPPRFVDGRRSVRDGESYWPLTS